MPAEYATIANRVKNYSSKRDCKITLRSRHASCNATRSVGPNDSPGLALASLPSTTPMMIAGDFITARNVEANSSYG